MTTPLDRLVGQIHAACDLAGRLAANAPTTNQRDRLDKVSGALAALANESMRLVMEYQEPHVFQQGLALETEATK